MKLKFICTIFLIGAWISVFAWVFAQRPPVHQDLRGGELISQEAIDAKQDLGIMFLNFQVMAHTEQIVALEADRNWLMGGIAAIGGIGILIQIMKILAMKKG